MNFSSLTTLFPSFTSRYMDMKRHNNFTITFTIIFEISFQTFTFFTIIFTPFSHTFWKFPFQSEIK